VTHECKATRRVRRPQGGTAPAHRGGKHHRGGNSTRGNPPANISELNESEAAGTKTGAAGTKTGATETKTGAAETKTEAAETKTKAAETEAAGTKAAGTQAVTTAVVAESAQTMTNAAARLTGSDAMTPHKQRPPPLPVWLPRRSRTRYSQACTPCTLLGQPLLQPILVAWRLLKPSLR